MSASLKLLFRTGRIFALLLSALLSFCAFPAETPDLNALLKECSADNAASCMALGRFYMQDPDDDKKADLAFQYFGKACALGLTWACYYQSDLEEERYIREVEEKAAKIQAQNQKLQKQLDAAQRATADSEKSELQQPQNAATGSTYEKCLKNDGRACLYLGVLNFLGRGGYQKNYTQAAAYHAKACDLNVPKACFYLVSMSHKGQGVVMSEENSAVFYTKGCALGYPLACSQAARRFMKGMGVKQDKAKARELNKRACEGGVEISCKYLGSGKKTKGQ